MLVFTFPALPKKINGLRLKSVRFLYQFAESCDGEVAGLAKLDYFFFATLQPRGNVGYFGSNLIRDSKDSVLISMQQAAGLNLHAINGDRNPDVEDMGIGVRDRDTACE